MLPPGITFGITDYGRRRNRDGRDIVNRRDARTERASLELRLQLEVATHPSHCDVTANNHDKCHDTRVLEYSSTVLKYYNTVLE